MIKDNIKNYFSYTALSENFKKALTYLVEGDFFSFKEEKITLDGQTVFALHQIYETETITGKVFECHKHYADIQYILEGEEVIRVSTKDKLVLESEYDETNDCCFYKCDTGTDLLLNKGDFAIFFPQDAHIAKIMSQNPCSVKKIVLKIRI